MWLALGLPLWVVELATRGGSEPTAALTHIGGLVIGLVGIRKLGLAGPVWWKATAALADPPFHLPLGCPVDANINLAFAVWPGWEPYFPSHGVYSSRSRFCA